MSPKKLWLYPLLFGLIGAFVGLLLRYAFTGLAFAFPFKNYLHAHSHVMLLGFLFNALLILIWTNFSHGIDKISYNYYISLQFCMAIMIIAFIVQGYGLYSILFSTLHLWISYILLIRLWKRLVGDKVLLKLVKLGIIFHFISSLGPYTLGPLMVLEMKGSSWYDQAIFFYLHFQFFGIFFTWLLALLIQKANLILTKKHIFGIAFSLVFLFAHSLDYSFDHVLIQFFGGLGSILLFVILLKFKSYFRYLKRPYRFIYYTTLFIAIINIIGSIPYIAQLVVDSRFLLIAWLHFLFLALYVPFVWIFLEQRISTLTWSIYGFGVIISEAILIFPNMLNQLFSISIMWLLLIAYLGVFLAICAVHLPYLLGLRKRINQPNRN